MVAISLAILAMKKSQTAIYYCLGDPAYLDSMTRRAIERKELVKDSLMRWLVQIEQLIQRRGAAPEVHEKDVVLQEADSLIKTASEIIESITGEKA